MTAEKRKSSPPIPPKLVKETLTESTVINHARLGRLKVIQGRSSTISDLRKKKRRIGMRIKVGGNVYDPSQEAPDMAHECMKDLHVRCADERAMEEVETPRLPNNKPNGAHTPTPTHNISTQLTRFCNDTITTLPSVRYKKLEEPKTNVLVATHDGSATGEDSVTCTAAMESAEVPDGCRANKVVRNLPGPVQTCRVNSPGSNRSCTHHIVAEHKKPRQQHNEQQQHYRRTQVHRHKNQRQGKHQLMSRNNKGRTEVCDTHSAVSSAERIKDQDLYEMEQSEPDEIVCGDQDTLSIQVTLSEEEDSTQAVDTAIEPQVEESSTQAIWHKGIVSSTNDGKVEDCGFVASNDGKIPTGKDQKLDNSDETDDDY